MSEDPKYHLVFAQGRLETTGAPPEWFVQAAAQDGDWHEALRKHDVSRVEQLGEHGDTIQIFRSPNGYYVEIHDVFEMVARIFIDGPADYLHFRRDWVLPLVQLSRIADEAAEKQDAR